MYCAGYIANSCTVECAGVNGYQLVSVWDGSDLIQIPVLPRGEVITLYYSFPIILSIMLTDFAYYNSYVSRRVCRCILWTIACHSYSYSLFESQRVCRSKVYVSNMNITYTLTMVRKCTYLCSPIYKIISILYNYTWGTSL